MPNVHRDLPAEDFPSAGEKAFVGVALFLSTGACQNLWLNTHVAPTPECKRWECLNHALDLPRYASSSCASLQGLDRAL